MSKIFDALLRAQRERKGLVGLQEIETVAEPAIPTSGISVIDLEMEMIHLFQRINSLLPDTKGKVVQFVSSGSSEGTSSLARSFAETVVERLDSSALLLDCNREKHHQIHFGLNMKSGWEEVITDNKPVKDVIYQVNQSRLFYSIVSVKGDRVGPIFDSPKILDLFKVLKGEFDFIILDSPSISRSNIGLALCNKVDGVVMVVESESTRWQVARSSKEKIEKRGGKFLGVVLNKKKHYIPEFVYKRLL